MLYLKKINFTGYKTTIIGALSLFSIFPLLDRDTLFAQTIKGKVVEINIEKKEIPLFGANVYWKGTTAGTTTDQDGNFEIAPIEFPASLMISFVGYKNDSVFFHHHPEAPVKSVLQSTLELKTVEVEARQQTTHISTINPINVEKITQGELKKAACCNLSESFETNATVDVTYTDAVSGAKKIQMLGLTGAYSQIMFENIPLIRGLSSNYGFGYIPGTWIKAISVIKGSGSVINGYESISGQLCLDFLQPDEAEKLFINVYANHQQRLELNIHTAKKFNEKWSSMLFLHGNDQRMKQDLNKDSFLDMPLKRQYTAMNRWKYQGEKLISQFGARAMQEDRLGGQISFNHNKDFGTTNAYGMGISDKQLDVFAKNGLLFPDQPYKSLGIITSGRIHRLNSFYGLREYEGEQKMLYANMIYQSIISSTLHTFKTGASYMLDDYNEIYSASQAKDSSFKRTESVPGIFAEYTYNDEEKYSAVAGIRADMHNLYGIFLSPRLHLKYNFLPLSAIRLSIGRGYRRPNIFVENSTVLASSRQVIVEQNVRPEIAWNGGISITHKFKIAEKDAILNTDFFRTEFENQVVVDLENAREVRFYNLDGRSFSNSFQVDFSFEPVKKLDVKTSYKWYDVQTEFHSGLKQKPFVPKNRALFNIAYTTKYDKWKFDATLQWYGISRLPDTSINPEKYQVETSSENYYIINSQITRNFLRWEIYLGVENLLHYIQPNAIIAADAPFGNSFDASMLWGPISGRTIYAGARFSIK